MPREKSRARWYTEEEDFAASYPTCVIVFADNTVADSDKKLEIRGILRLQGWGDLRLEERTITYGAKLIREIDKLKEFLGAPGHVILNAAEAQQIAQGTLHNAASNILFSCVPNMQMMKDLYFEDGSIRVVNVYPSRPDLLLEAGG